MGNGRPAIYIGWVKGTRPYMTIRYTEGPAGPVSMSGQTMRSAELNIDIFHNGPSAYAAGILAREVYRYLNQRHIPDAEDPREIYRISEARRAHIPEQDQNVAHWNVSFFVRWYDATFADELIARG
jgi:hypothetical protein